MEAFSPLHDSNKVNKNEGQILIDRVVQQFKKSQEQSSKASEIATQANQYVEIMKGTLEQSANATQVAIRQIQETNSVAERATKLTEAALIQAAEYQKIAHEAQIEVENLRNKYAQAQLRIVQLERVIFDKRSA